MDLADLKNIDVNDLFNKLKSGGFGDKKLLIKFGIGFGAVLIFLIIYYVFVSPVVTAQEEKLKIMNENREKIIEFNNNIGTLKGAVTKLEPEYEKNSKLFHSKKEVEDLYQNISKFALLNGLSIVNLKKSEPKAVNGSNQTSTENNSEQNSSSENNEGPQVLYYEIPVEYEIQGNFLSYLKFRRALSKSSKVINYDKEEITTLTETQGQILSKGTISIVGLPNEYQ
ncbi:pilus assembly protein PilO [Candidatus Pelagibacter sp.]|jgi:Tfp pilus assembly protein PilO|nr:pilus assembly protein PilO [Candidatus Pelagibacter sp.]